MYHTCKHIFGVGVWVMGEVYRKASEVPGIIFLWVSGRSFRFGVRE